MQPDMPPAELPEGYYHDNFNLLIEHALALYNDLLTPEEHAWIKRYQSLELAAQRLLVRLFSRRGIWFRSDKLRYAEIPDLNLHAKALADQGLVTIPDTIETKVLCQALWTRPEILACFPQLPRSASKAELTKQAVERADEVDASSLPFEVYQLIDDDLLSTFTLLFFANARQDLSQFVLSDLGLQRFESYPLSTSLRFFSSRTELDNLSLLARLSDQHYQLDKALTPEQRLAELEAIICQMPEADTHPYVSKKHQGLVNRIARDFERLQDYDKALSLFQSVRLSPSRERQVRILGRLSQWQEAKPIVTDMLTNPGHTEELETARRLQRQVWKKLGEQPPETVKPNVDSIHLELDLSEQRVEQAVALHLTQQGWQVYFQENAFLCGLFGLAFWEVIYAPVDGAFINAYQRGPKDLYSRDFVRKRQHLIDARFQMLETDPYSLIKQQYREKQGITNPFVHWKIFSFDLIEQAQSALAPEQLLALFRVLLQDIKAYQTGMPDLIAFKEGEYLWMEVKGPGDKLQHNQWRWITAFNQLGIRHQVCFVNQ